MEEKQRVDIVEMGQLFIYANIPAQHTYIVCARARYIMMENTNNKYTGEWFVVLSKIQ